MQLHQQLHSCTSNEQYYTTATTLLANYRENALIWKELNHYQATRQILGQHSIFKIYKEIEKITTLPVVKRIAKRNATQKAIREIKANLKKNNRPDLEQARKEKLSFYTDLIQEIDKHLSSLG